MKLKTRDIKKREYGPFEMEDVIHKIYPQTQIKFEGEDKWQIAGDLKLFQEEFKKRKINSYLPKGRISGSTYFAYSLLIYLSIRILGGLTSMLADASITSTIVARIIIVFLVVFFLIVLYAKVVLVVRRLHDLSLSGLWCILALPIIPLADLLLFFWPGKKGKNKYGQNPKYRPVTGSTSNAASNKKTKDTFVKKLRKKTLGALNFSNRYISSFLIFIISIFISIISGFYFKRLNSDILIEAIIKNWNIDEIIELYRLQNNFFNLEYFEYNWNAFIMTFICSLVILILLKIYSIRYVSKDKLIKFINKIEGRSIE